MIDLWITIPSGEVLNEEPECLSAKISYLLNEEKTIINDDSLNNFFNLVEDKLPGRHFIVDSEEADNLEFLSFITHWFNNDSLTQQTLDFESRIIETTHQGPFILVNDAGYKQLRCKYFQSLIDLYNWYCRFDAEKHLDNGERS